MADEKDSASATSADDITKDWDTYRISLEKRKAGAFSELRRYVRLQLVNRVPPVVVDFTACPVRPELYRLRKLATEMNAVGFCVQVNEIINRRTGKFDYFEFVVDVNAASTK